MDALHVLQERGDDAASVFEQHVGKIDIERDGRSHARGGEAVGRKAHAVDKEKHFSATHDVLVNDVFVGFRERQFGSRYDDGLVGREDVGVERKGTTIDLKIFAKRHACVVNLFGSQFAMAFDEGDFFDRLLRLDAERVGKGEFEIFDGVVKVFRSADGGIVLKQTDGDGVTVIDDFSPREDEFLDGLALVVFFINNRGFQTPSGEGLVVLLTLLVRIGLGRVDEVDGPLAASVDADFVKRLLRSLFQSQEGGVEVAIKIDIDDDVLVKLTSHGLSVIADGETFFVGQVKTKYGDLRKQVDDDENQNDGKCL